MHDDIRDIRHLLCILMFHPVAPHQRRVSLFLPRLTPVRPSAILRSATSEGDILRSSDWVCNSVCRT